MKAFSQLRVLELAGSPAGAYAGKLYADYGAHVLRVEPPGGDPLRSAGEPWQGMGSLFAYLNTSKRATIVDRSESRGVGDFQRLLDSADVVLESSAPEPLDPVTREMERERLVKAYISPFGLTGPYASYRSNELTDEAIGGHLYLNGEPHREPLQRPGLHACYQAGAYAFAGTLAALLARERSGCGQVVEVTHFEGLASLHQYTTVMYTQADFVLRRVGNAQGGPSHPVGIYACKDGYVHLAMPITSMIEPFLRAAGLEDVAADPRFADDFVRGQHKKEFDRAIQPWLLEHTAAEIVELGQSVRSPIGPVPSMLEVIDDPHLAARDFWRNLGEGGSGVRLPRGPFLIQDHPSRLRMAPTLGDDSNREIERFVGGADPDAELAYRSESPMKIQGNGSPAGARVHQPANPAGKFRPLSGADGVTPPRNILDMTSSERLVSTENELGLPRQDSRVGALDGIRVLDLTRVWAGPLAARILADLGADVIKVEASWARGGDDMPAEAASASHLFPEDDPGDEPFNREVSYNKLNRNKRALTLELNTAKGKELFEALVRRADIVIENFSPRVMAKLGLGWERLHELNERLIYVAMPGFGSSGPYRDWLAFGPLIEAASGLSQQMGYQDSGPYRSGLAFPDPVTSLHAVGATLLALADRESDRLGRGRWVEVPMFESMACFNGEEMIATQLRGRAAPRLGNRHTDRAPQGCYACAGEDQWLAISVTSDEEWQSLCGVAGLAPELFDLGLSARWERHDEIDAALASWCSSRRADELMELLQSRGVIAATVSDARRLVEDPHLEEGDFWVESDHRSVGLRRYPGLPIRFSATPASYRRGAPCLGEHNREVLAEILGLSDGEIDALEAEGVLAKKPPPGATYRGVVKQKDSPT